MKYYFNFINETISLKANNGNISNFPYRYIDTMITAAKEQKEIETLTILKYLKEIYSINKKVFACDEIFTLSKNEKMQLEERLKDGELIAIKELIISSSYLTKLNEINKYFPLVISNYINDIFNLKVNHQSLFDFNTMTFVRSSHDVDILNVINDSENYSYMDINIDEDNLLNSTISINKSRNE